MPAALQYLNKELRSAAGKRTGHEARRTDLQKLSREARIQARKRLFRPVTSVGRETAGWLEDGLDLSVRTVRSLYAQTKQLARQRPLYLAAGAILAGIAVSLLIRRR